MEISTEIAADPEIVFSFFADPEKLAQWLGAGARLGAKPGDELCVPSPGRQTARGRLIEITPPHRAVFSWGYEDSSLGLDVGSSLVTITLTPIPQGTRVTVLHSGLPNEEIAAEHRNGWLAHISSLANMAAQTQAGHFARTAVDAYLRAWAEPERAKRDVLLESCWAPDGHFADGIGAISGREQLSWWIENALRMSRGACMTLKGVPSFCQGAVKFEWEVKVEDTVFASGVNFGHLNKEGLFTSVYGFWN
jgi:uncharacterized protein YndB with AHSA1/START domain